MILLTGERDVATLNRLAQWRDSAVSGGLPIPFRKRWQPLRAGVENLWEYDHAEV